VIREIIARGKAAGKIPQIILTTYYDPFPDEYGQCRDIAPLDLKLRKFGLSPGEMAWLKGRLLKLNDNIREVTRKYTKVTLVDLESSLRGHQWCSKDPWAYGPSIMTQAGFGTNPAPFHLLPASQDVVGGKVTAAIRKLKLS
jgi:hypothetical protein